MNPEKKMHCSKKFYIIFSFQKSDSLNGSTPILQNSLQNLCKNDPTKRPCGFFYGITFLQMLNIYCFYGRLDEIITYKQGELLATYAQPLQKYQYNIIYVQ